MRQIFRRRLAVTQPCRKLTMHIWKHTCCTHMRAMGKSVEDIQDWVGHVNIQNSLEYSHITNAGRDQMAQSLRDVWR